MASSACSRRTNAWRICMIMGDTIANVTMVHEMLAAKLVPPDSRPPPQ